MYLYVRVCTYITSTYKYVSNAVPLLLIILFSFAQCLPSVVGATLSVEGSAAGWVGLGRFQLDGVRLSWVWLGWSVWGCVGLCWVEWNDPLS